MPKIDFLIDKFPDSIYSKDHTTNLYKLLSSLGTELDNFVMEMDNIKSSHFVDEAVGDDLDKIATILNIRRFFNESDQSFRGRIKTTIPSFIGGGTISSIKHVVQEYLGVLPVVIEHYKPGNGHAFFDNGVLNGCNAIQASGLNLEVKAGTAYLSGARITFNDSQVSLPINSTRFIKLNSNATIVHEADNILTSTQILLAKVDTNASTITNILDMRNMVDPYAHYITNTSTISIQIPYNFTESLITLQDVKNVLIKTRAAGVAMLINVVGAYGDKLDIHDHVDFSFMIGFSGMGSANYIGGQ